MNKLKRGFLAIDIDGTALVEKIDKNPLYGLRNTKSHIRQSLIEYMRKAQEKGYEIIILTARPELLEPGLKLGVIGTKDTQSIVEQFSEYDIKVIRVERAPAGLKGKKMEEILALYHKGAIGMLFDDQLKQVADVRSKENNRLMAFDINSTEDLLAFIEQVPSIDETNGFHPRKMVNTALGLDPALHRLKRKIESITNDTPDMKDVLGKLFSDLVIRQYEAQYRDYKPEIQWVNKVMLLMENLMDKLNNKDPLSLKDIDEAYWIIFNVSHVSECKPNSSADTLTKEMLEEFRKIVIMNTVIDDLKTQCLNFELKEGVIDDPQLNVVKLMVAALEKPNPFNALKIFKLHYDANIKIFQKKTEGNIFFEAIHSVLVKIADFFKTPEEKLVASVENFFEPDEHKSDLSSRS